MSKEQLLQSVSQGDVNQVRALLMQSPTLITTRNSQHEPLLLLAVRAGSREMVQLLVEHRADINLQSNEMKLTPLLLAVRLGQLEIYRFLMSQGANPLLMGDYGRSVLHEAASHNHAAILGDLLRGVARSLVNTKAHRSRTPLHDAAKEGHAESVKILLEVGADVDAVDEQLGSALHYAVAKRSMASLTVLIQNKASFESENSVGDTPLQTALSLQQPRAVLYELLHRGASTNKPNSRNVTAWSYAQSKDQAELLKSCQEEAAVWQASAFELAREQITKQRRDKLDFAGDWFKSDQWEQLFEILDKYSQVTYVHLGKNLERATRMQKSLLEIKLGNNRTLQKAIELAKKERLTELQVLLQDSSLVAYTGYNVFHIIALSGNEAMVESAREQGIVLCKDKKGNYPSDIARKHRYFDLSQQLRHLEQLQSFDRLLQANHGKQQEYFHYEVERHYLKEQLRSISLPDTFNELLLSAKTMVKQLPTEMLVNHGASVWQLLNQCERLPEILSRQTLARSNSSESVDWMRPAELFAQKITEQIQFCEQQTSLRALIVPLQKLRAYYLGLKEWAAGEPVKSYEQAIKAPTVMFSVLGQRLLTEQAHELLCGQAKKSNSFGMHTVVAYQGVHYKLKPHAPGIEFAVDSLNKIIAGQGSTPTELIKIKAPNQPPKIFLASKTVVGKELEHVIEHYSQHLDKIDPFNFSSMIVQSLLTSPQDGKADNFMVRLEADEHKQLKRIFIVGVDNDVSFAEPFVRYSQGENKGKHFINVKNVLYFFPQMSQPINAELREHLLKQTPERIMLEWIAQLADKNESYQKLLDEGVFTQEEFRGDGVDYGLQLPIRFVAGTLIKIYQTLVQLHTFIKQHPEATHNQLFEHIQPLLYHCYQHVKNNKPSIIEQQHALYDSMEPPVEKRLESRYTTQELAEQLAPYTGYAFTFEETRQSTISDEFESWFSQLPMQQWTSAQQQTIQHDCKHLGFVQKLTLKAIPLDRAETLLGWVKSFNKLETLIFKETPVTAVHFQLISALKPDISLMVEQSCLDKAKPEHHLNELYQSHPRLILRLNNTEYALNEPSTKLLEQMARSNDYVHWLVIYLLNYRNVMLNRDLGGGNTIVHVAAEQSQNNLMSALIEKRANIHQQNHSGYTTLHIAAQKGDVVMLELLIRNNINPTLRKKHDNQTARDAAKAHQHHSIVRRLEVYEKHWEDNSPAAGASANLALSTLCSQEMLAPPEPGIYDLTAHKYQYATPSRSMTLEVQSALDSPSGRSRRKIGFLKL